MMKKLLLLVLIAVARDATAEDTKCIREGAAMPYPGDCAAA